jgi:hypothetical protein
LGKTDSDEGSPRQMSKIMDLGFRERRRMKTPGARWHTTYIGSRPAVEDRYILLAIKYMIIDVFTGCRRRWIVSSLCLICGHHIICPKGYPAWTASFGPLK